MAETQRENEWKQMEADTIKIKTTTPYLELLSVNKHVLAW